MVDQRSAKIANRLIDSCFEHWVLPKHAVKGLHIVIAECLADQLDSFIHGCGCCINMFFQLCPAIKTIFAGDDMLCVRKLWRSLQFKRAEPGYSLWLLLLKAVQQCLGLFAQVLKVGISGKIFAGKTCRWISGHETSLFVARVRYSGRREVCVSNLRNPGGIIPSRGRGAPCDAS